MVYCHCGKHEVIYTSWTPRNPGHRFYACPNLELDCKFIDWVDLAMCQRAVVIIPRLLRNTNNLQANLREAQGDHARVSILEALGGYARNMDSFGEEAGQDFSFTTK
ncbi:zinc finger, GRF-type containing protein [Tanacetum coccineum]